jgi:siroheme synthase
MPGFNYAETAGQLIAAGLRPATPCAIISRATTKQQRVHRTTVADLPNAPQLPAPTLLLIGDVVASEPVAIEGSEPLWDPLAQAVVASSTERDLLFEKQVGSTDPEFRQ